MNFKPNCKLLALCDPVICPKIGLPGSNDPPAGPPENVQTGWFSAFRASKRNCRLFPSVMRKFLCKLKSASKKFGPATLPTEQVPNVLGAGMEMFDGSIH